MTYKKFLCLFIVIQIFTSFGFDGSLSSETSAVSAKPQSLHNPVQTGDCDWPMVSRTPEGNRVAPDSCGSKTDQLELLAKWDGPIGRPTTKLLIENDKFYFGSENGYFYCCRFNPFEKFWEFQTGDRILSNPIISNSKVYFGSNDTKFYCLSVDTGLLLWEYKTGSYIQSSPAISNGKVYFGSYDKKLYCLSADTGQKLWEYQTSGAIESLPAISNNKVYFGSYDGKLYCIKEGDGKKVWEYKPSEFDNAYDHFSSPIVVNGKVFCGSDTNSKDQINISKFYCFNGENGEIIWDYLPNGRITSSPVFIKDKVYFGSWDKKFYCLNIQSGYKEWDFKTSEYIYYSPVAINNKVYFITVDYKIYCINGESGNMFWVYQANEHIPTPLSIYNNNAFFGSADKKIYCIAIDNGQKVWEFGIGWSFSTSPIISNGKIYAGSTFGKMYCISIATRQKLWEYQTGGKIFSSPAISNGKVYFGSNDYKFYCLNAESGEKLWEYKTDDGTVYASSPVISNGRVFFGTAIFDVGMGRLYCLSAENGEKLWDILIGSTLNLSPAIWVGKVYIGSSDKILYCLNADNGQKLWEYQTGAKIYSSPAISNGKVYFGSDDNKFYCLSAETGQKFWEYQTVAEIYSSPAISNGKVYFGVGYNRLDGMFFCLNSENGQKIWEYESGPISSSAILTNKKVYFISGAWEGSSIKSLDADNGQKSWEYKSFAGFALSPTIAEGKVFAVNEAGIMYCFGDKDPNVIPPPSPPAPPVYSTTPLDLSFSAPSLQLDRDYSNWYKNQDGARKDLEFYDISFTAPANLDISEVQTSNLQRKPDLPCYALRYKLPQDQDFVSLERMPPQEETVDIKGAVIPTSMQVPITVGGKPYVWPDEIEYNMIENDNKPLCGPPVYSPNMPSPPIGVGGDPYKWPDEVFLKDSNELIIYINPAYADHKNKKIIYSKNLKINIKTRIKTKPHETGVMGHVTFQKYYPNSHNSSTNFSPSRINTTEAYDMCIITSKNLIGSLDSRMDDFADYANWKTNKGIKTKCFDIDYILSKYPSGVSDIQKMKYFLNEQKYSNGIKYVILGGDSKTVPTRLANIMANSYRAMIPSDSYFTSWAFDWETDNIIESQKIYPELYVGRIPASDKYELKNYIDKVLQYDNTKFDENYHKSFLLFGEKLYKDNDTGYQAWGGDFLDHETAEMPINNPKLTLLYDKISTNGTNTAPNKKMVIYNNKEDIIGTIGNTNPHFMFVDCHGNPSCFGKLCKADLERINTKNPGFFVSSTSCNVNQFADSFVYNKDNKRSDFSSSDYLAKAFIFQNSGGALAFAGNSAFGWFNPYDIINSTSSRYQKNFINNLLSQDKTLGQAFWESKITSYSLKDNDASEWWTYNAFNLLGDPSLEIKLKDENGSLPEDVDRIILDPLNSSMEIGETKQFNALAVSKGGKLLPNATFDWVIVPSDFGVINPSGNFTALKSGVCYLTAKSGNILSQTARIEIRYKPVDIQKIVIIPEEALVQTGKSFQFTAIAFDKDNNPIFNLPFEWSLSNSGVGTITQEGLFKANHIEYPTLVYAKYNDIIGKAIITVTK